MTKLGEIFSDKISIETIQGKGVGVLATQHITAGEVLFREKPMCVITNWSEQTVAKVFNDLEYEEQESFLSLANSQVPSIGRIAGIALTNMIPMETPGAYGIYRNISRINHDCLPNCNHYQDSSDFCSKHKDMTSSLEVSAYNPDKERMLHNYEQITAVQDIKPGEEITISYRNPIQEGFVTRMERQSLLAEGFGFDCSCKACSLADGEAKEDDNIRKQILEIKNTLMGDRMERETVLKMSIKWMSLMIKANFHVDHQLDPVFMCYSAAAAMGQRKASIHWASKGYHMAVIARGPKSRYATFFREQLEKINQRS